LAAPEGKAVFINAPFDAAYEPLFITLVGMLVFLGQEPYCVLEVREKGEGRLARIIELIRNCRMSIHDLSRVGLPARFNMPFELGLACTVTCLLDTFQTSAGTALSFRRAAGVLRKSAKVIKQQLATPSVFRPSLFRHLVAAATKIGRDRGFIAG